jgi:hypothetical protein
MKKGEFAEQRLGERSSCMRAMPFALQGLLLPSSFCLLTSEETPVPLFPGAASRSPSRSRGTTHGFSALVRLQTAGCIPDCNASMRIQPVIGIIERDLICKNYTSSPHTSSLRLHTAIVACGI